MSIGSSLNNFADRRPFTSGALTGVAMGLVIPVIGVVKGQPVAPHVLLIQAVGIAVLLGGMTPRWRPKITPESYRKLCIHRASMVFGASLLCAASFAAQSGAVNAVKRAIFGQEFRNSATQISQPATVDMPLMPKRQMMIQNNARRTLTT